MGDISKKLKSRLTQKFVNLEATLLRAKMLRELSKAKVNYIVQSAIQNEQSSQIFSLTRMFNWAVLDYES